MYLNIKLTKKQLFELLRLVNKEIELNSIQINRWLDFNKGMESEETSKIRKKLELLYEVERKFRESNQ